MPLIVIVFSGLALWLIGEFVAFSLVAEAIGLNGAIIATLATSFAGALLLRRLGSAARQNLVGMLNPRGASGGFALERLQAGLSAAFGAGLLILPGFLSDSIGLLLVARAALAWISSGGRRPGGEADDVIELSPREWRHVEETERP